MRSFFHIKRSEEADLNLCGWSGAYPPRDGLVGGRVAIRKSVYIRRPHNGGIHYQIFNTVGLSTNNADEPSRSWRKTGCREFTGRHPETGSN